MQKMEAFGGQLFDAVFTRDIYELYRTACQRVEDRDGGIRLVLSLRNAPELLDVPWEFLFDRPYWLSLRRRTPVVRVLELARVRNPARIDGKVRILGMVSSPLGYPPLNVQAERQVIDDALAPPVERGFAEVVWVPGASLTGLNEALMDGEFHIFHYVGHAGFDRSSNEGVLVLEDSSRNVNEVSNHY
ncbi:MAG TPA: CHAT domain-containing protein [Acidimicrobiales bacterium]|nr:CHAT domain-containing protein [Acidimicrobiales bacterium]